MNESNISERYTITAVEKMLEEVLPSKGFQNRMLTVDELWAIGLIMLKTGQIFRFRIISETKGTIVEMEA